MADVLAVQFDLNKPDELMVRDLMEVAKNRLGTNPTVEDFGAVMAGIGQLASLIWLMTDIEGRALLPFLRGLTDQVMACHYAMAGGRSAQASPTISLGMADTYGPRPIPIRCPRCGHRVHAYFDHIAIDCAHDMTPKQIAELLAAVEVDIPEAPNHG